MTLDVSAPPLPAVRELQQAAREIQQYKYTATTERALLLVQAAQRALAEIRNPLEGKIIVDQLSAVELYFKRQKAELNACNILVGQRLMTERRIGELLPGLISEGNPQLLQAVTVKLEDMKISRRQSMNWQHLAQIELEDFRHAIRQAIDEEQELSEAWALRYWSEHIAPEVVKSNGHAQDEEVIPASEPPENFPEDWTHANFGNEIQDLLSECGETFSQITGMTADRDIIELCETMDARIKDLFKRMKTT